ncbi:MAG TPA: MMPL family transporter [Streptosporangiaceae bacterium]|nr:MMPL family transporter [Streptosporangiaceae bacterium]
MFLRLGRGVVRHPWLVIGIWIVAAVAIIGLAPKLGSSNNESSFLPSHYQSVQAQNLQQSAFPTSAAPGAIVVFERADGGKLTAADSSQVDSIAGKLAADRIPTLGSMQAGPPSANKLIQTISIQIPNVNGELTTAQTNAIGTLRSNLASFVSGTDLKAGVTGTVAEDVDSASTGNKAQEIVFSGTILLIIVLLLIIFRSPIIVLLPLLTIGLVSSVANGLIDFVSKAAGWSADSFTSILLIVVLFGVGTDYILFLLFRYRERLRAGEPSKQAMESAIGRVGPAIATAAGAVMIAFLALTLSSLSLFRQLGPALAIAVFSAATAGLTLVPAVVSLLGTRVFWPSKAWKIEPKAARFTAIGQALGRHPGRFAGTTVVLLGLLAIISFGFHPTFDLTAGNTATTQSAVYSNVLLKGFPAGDSEPADVLVQSTDGRQLDNASLTSFGAQLAKVPGVASVSSAKVNSSGDVADYTVILSASGESAAAMNTVRGPLDAVVRADAPAGSRALVGGITSVYVDLQSAMEHDYSIVFPVAAAVILIILGLLLQSVVAPWYLMIFVGLGFAATLGATVGVFQDLGNQSGLTFILPIMMYLFVVALGTDYNILMVSRLREESVEGKTPREAAAIALKHAGPTIASAGLILAGTFASLILAGGSTFSQMGFAISCGIVIAAFVMAMFLTPSVTALLGSRAWWPGHQNQGGHGKHRDQAAGDGLPSGLDDAASGARI